MSLAHHDAENWRSYRESVASDPLYSYFRFPEFPETLSTDVHNRVLQSAAAVTEGLATVVQMMMDQKLDIDGVVLEEFLDIPSHIMYWIKKYYRPQEKVFWGRPDFYIADGKPWLLETNLASAAGYQPQVSALCQYYSDHPAWQEASRQQRLVDPLINLCKGLGHRVNAGELVLFADIREKKRHGTRVRRPYSGMISWIESHTDLRIRSAFMHELSFRSDGVYLKHERVDHVFMSYYNPHVFDRFDEFLPLWHSQQEGQVSMLDSLTEILLSNKLLLAFISEYADQLPLADEVLFAFQRTVPWTRMLRDGLTRYEGETVRFLDTVKAHQDRFVLKRAQSAEGREVFVGKQVPTDNWVTQIDQAAHDGGWIIQQYIQPDPCEIMVPGPHSYKMIQVEASFSPYLLNGQFAGYLNRYYDPTPEIGSANSSKKIRLEWLGTTAVTI